ncbi:MAG: hypothetical protein K2J93_01920 [Anaeroplasmataceae bacterium]|nr:hypothetical protein [Anaeroplasmataceae bacterium]
MKKIGKLAVMGLLATLGVTALASCGGNDLAKELLTKVIIVQKGENVSADFVIPKSIVHQGKTYDIAWTSSDESVLSFEERTEKDGSVKYYADIHRPFDADADVTLTATVDANGKKASESFKTTVEKIDFEKAAVANLGIAASYNREDIEEPAVVNLPTSTSEYKDVINYTYALEGTSDSVKLENGTKLTVDPSSGAKEVVDLKVTATSSVTKDIIVKVNVNQVTYSSIEEYDAAEEKTVITVKGIIVAREPYSASYKNATLYLQDISGKGGYDAYRIKCDSEEKFNKDLAIGNAILVTGEKALYNGLREFNAGCTYEVASTGKAYKDTDVTELIKTDASKVSLDLQCQLIHFNSLPVVKVDAEDTKGRWNITVGDEKDSNKQFVVRIDTGLLPITTDAYKAIKDLNISVGDVISAKGVAGWSKKAQLFPLAADSIVIESKGGSTKPETPVVSTFTGVVTDAGFKDDTAKVRCFALVQNADGAAKYVTCEVAVDATNTVDAIHAAWNAKFVVGKSATVTAENKEYHGLNQFVVAWDKLATDVTLGADGTTPAFLDITSKVTAGEDLKALQGVLVKVTGVCVVSGSNYTIQTADGKSILVYFDRAFYDGKASDLLKAGNTYTVSGFLNWYDNPQVTPISEDKCVVLVAEGEEPKPELPAGVLASCTFNKAFENGFTYIDSKTYGDSYYSDGGLKLNNEGCGVKSSTFTAVNSCEVVIKINKLNENTRTAASTDVFTVKAYNAAGEVVDTKTLTSVAEGDGNTVTLSGTGIVYVEVVMTGYPSNGTTCYNVNLGAVVVKSVA